MLIPLKKNKFDQNGNEIKWLSRGVYSGGTLVGYVVAVNRCPGEPERVTLMLDVDVEVE